MTPTTDPTPDVPLWLTAAAFLGAVAVGVAGAVAWLRKAGWV